MPGTPAFADYPVYKGNVDEELSLLDEMSRLKRTLGRKALRRVCSVKSSPMSFCFQGACANNL